MTARTFFFAPLCVRQHIRCVGSPCFLHHPHFLVLPLLCPLLPSSRPDVMNQLRAGKKALIHFQGTYFLMAYLIVTHHTRKSRREKTRHSLAFSLSPCSCLASMSPTEDRSKESKGCSDHYVYYAAAQQHLPGRERRHWSMGSIFLVVFSIPTSYHRLLVFFFLSYPPPPFPPYFSFLALVFFSSLSLSLRHPRTAQFLSSFPFLLFILIFLHLHSSS